MAKILTVSRWSHRPFETLVYNQQPNRSQSANCKFISGEVCHHVYKHVCLKLYTIGVETEEENIDKCESTCITDAEWVDCAECVQATYLDCPSCYGQVLKKVLCNMGFMLNPSEV